jgi:hypothetical protein
MPPSPSGGIIIIFQVRDHAAALDLQKFQNDPNNPGTADRKSFAVTGIPGAIGADYTLVGAGEHDANVSFVVGADVIDVAWKGPGDTDHATLLAWANAVAAAARRAGAG